MEYYHWVAIVFYFTIKPFDTACLDGDPRCGYWASIHQCELKPSTLLTTCPWSCGNSCECTVPTLDTACDCLLRAKNGECETNPEHLAHICKTMCETRLSTNCSVLPALSDSNAALSTQDRFYLTTVDEVCNPGYKPLVPAHKGRKLCMKNGLWTDDPFYDTSVACKRLDCGTPVEIEDGTRTFTSTLFQSTVVYACDVGYKVISGDLIRTCDTSGAWNGSLLACKRIKCHPPPVVEYSIRYGALRYYNNTVRYACNSGYRHTSGDLERRCLINGTWSGTSPTCQSIHCPKPVDIPHASMTYTGTYFLSRTKYYCHLGYNVTSGDPIRYCLSNLIWSGMLPQCSIITCGEPPLVAGAKSNATGFKYADVVTYECYFQEVENHIYRWTKTCETTAIWTGEDGTCAAVRKKFEATPLEAKGSVAFGTAAVSILIVILVCIIILDIPTVVRQSKYMIKNTRAFRKYIRMHLTNNGRWAKHKRISLSSIADVPQPDKVSIRMSTLSLQSIGDDDGLRILSSASMGSREFWSRTTSEFTLDEDPLNSIATISQPPLTTSASQPTGVSGPGDHGGMNPPRDVNVVQTDVEVHNLD